MLSLIEEKLSLKKLSDTPSKTTFESNHPLDLPVEGARGVYGGYFVATALGAALQTVTSDFKPHALHSFFIKAGNNQLHMYYEVDKIDTSRNFAKRMVNVYQEGVVVYQCMVSLTKKNSFKEELEELVAKAPSSEKPVPPYRFQGPIPLLPPPDSKKLLQPPARFSHGGLLAHRFPYEYWDWRLAPQEKEVTPAGRPQTYYVKCTNTLVDPNSHFTIIGAISDSYFLQSVPRLFRLKLQDISKIFSVSLDHTIYFHDTDFKADDWLMFKVGASRFSNNRILLNGEMYNRKGELVCTIIQEGLVYFRDESLRSRL